MCVEIIRAYRNSTAQTCAFSLQAYGADKGREISPLISYVKWFACKKALLNITYLVGS